MKQEFDIVGAVEKVMEEFGALARLSFLTSEDIGISMRLEIINGGKRAGEEYVLSHVQLKATPQGALEIAFSTLINRMKLRLLSAENDFRVASGLVHGDCFSCPACSAPGHLDRSGSAQALFVDSIWWNTKGEHWECIECYLK